MVKKTSEYNVDNIFTPTAGSLVRKRISVYLNSNDSKGATTGLREIVDNGFDEGLLGHGDTVTVRFYADGSAEVEDHGRGIPVDSKNGDPAQNGFILTVGTIGSGGKFSSDTNGSKATGGLNGMGASATNFSARRFDVTVYRDGKMHQLSFKEGVPGFFAKENDPDSKFTPNPVIKVSKDPRSATVRKKTPTGTKIHYWLDHTVFTADAAFLVEDIKARVKASCFLMPNMTAIVEDYRNSDTPEVDKYHYDAGIAEMVDSISPYPLMFKPIKLTAESSFTEKTNVLKNDNTLVHEDVTREVSMEVAFSYTADESTLLKSYVNLINTAQGGTHEAGLWRALSRVIIGHIKENKFLKAKEESPIIDDVRDGFVGAISISFPEPVFAGQAKEALNSTQITGLVSKSIGDELKLWLGNAKNKAAVKVLCSRVVEASRVRLAAKAQKDTARQKSALETSASMPSKLVECARAGSGSVGTELLVVEGDSALGGMRKARMSEFQALLPLRGKVLNNRKASLSAVLANAECASMIQAIGAGSGKSFDLADMRYERVIIASDADVDGAHIAVLLITFFHRVMPELISAGRLFILIPPLFELRFRVKGKDEVVYATDVAERDQLLDDLRRRRVGGVDVGRNKGLGEMDAGPIWDTLLNPENRRVKRVTMDDIAAADAMLELAMSDSVPPRKEWIVANHDKFAEGGNVG